MKSIKIKYLLYNLVINFLILIPGIFLFFYLNQDELNSNILLYGITIFSIYLIILIYLYFKIFKKKFDKQYNDNNIFDAIFNENSISYVIINLSNNKIIDANNKACDIMDLPKEDILNNTFNKFFECSEKFVEFLSNNDATLENYECYIHSKENTKLNILINSIKFISPKNEKLVLTGFINITDHKIASLEKDKAREIAEKANMMKSEFLTNMSHELRTPMNAIIGISRMLQKYDFSNLNKKQFEGLKVINQSGVRLLELINEILDISKIEAGKMVVKLELLSLEKLFYNIKTVIDTLVKEKGIRFYIRKSHHIPDQIISDESKLFQILINIIGNAAKFTEKGRIVLRIHDIKDKLYFEVMDTGIGISNENLKLIFKEFYQVDGSSSRKYSGTGLGLSLCKKLTNLLGGNIEIESELNMGTIVRFHIPFEYQKRDSDNINLQNNIKLKNSIPERQKKLGIVIDDNLTNQYLMKEYLLHNHYNIIFSSDGKNGLELIKQQKPNFILLELNLPDNSSVKILKVLKSDPVLMNIPVITTSVFDKTPEYNFFGLNTFIRKPINEVDLISKLKIIENYLNKEETEALIIGDDDYKNKVLANLIKQEKLNTITLSESAFSFDIIERFKPKAIIINSSKSYNDIDILRFIHQHTNEKIKNTYVIVNTYKEINEYRKNLTKNENFIFIQNNENINNKICDLLIKKLSDKQKKKILIVEDEETGIYILKMILENKYNLVVARDGQEAIDKYFSEKPDFVFMDIMMPHLDGIEALEAINKRQPDREIKIIAVTAKAMVGDKSDILNAGFDDYISKPFDEETIFKSIKKYLH